VQLEIWKMVTVLIENFRKWFEIARSRFVFKALDAAMTAPLRPARPVSTYLGSIVNHRSANYDRIASVIHLTEKIAPQLSSRLSRSLFRPEQLPFSVGGVELMSFGSGATVLLLKSENGPKVLKIYRRSLGRGPDGLLELANTFRRKYEHAASWYNGPFHLVPSTDFLILHGPLLRKPAVAALQAYVGGKRKDLLGDFKDNDLIALLRTNQELRDQFVFFTRQTIRLHDDLRICVDFLGRENLVLVNDGGRTRLLLVDYGIFDLNVLRTEAPATLSRVEDHISRLKSLLQRACSEEASQRVAATAGAGPAEDQSPTTPSQNSSARTTRSVRRNRPPTERSKKQPE
jgi:hypothetical protein